MGVWIETIVANLQYGVDMSHPVWVCGLKLEGSCCSCHSAFRHTLYGCVD